MGKGRSYLANFNTDSHRKLTDENQSTSGLRYYVKTLNFYNYLVLLI